MTKKATLITAGTIFTISSGVYSDYGVRGVFKALADIDTDGLLREWLLMHPEQGSDYAFEADDFLAWAFRKGLYEPIPGREWHVETYSCVDSSVSDYDPDDSE